MFNLHEPCTTVHGTIIIINNHCNLWQAVYLSNKSVSKFWKNTLVSYSQPVLSFISVSVSHKLLNGYAYHCRI